MLETLEIKKKQHEIKIQQYKNIQKYYNPFLWTISIIYFLYFMFINNSLSVHLLPSFVIGLTLWSIGLAINLKLLHELKGKEKILNIETINERKKKYMSPGKKKRYITDYNATKDELEKIMTYAKFMLEAKERENEIKDDNRNLDI
jgi:ATP synthase protein I